MSRSLFESVSLANNQFANRIAMAPMTRSRTTQPGDVPNQMMATYYAQRASAGLIISEGAPISAVGRGYSMTPGIYTKQHIEGWKKVTQAVHDKGGKIFIQLWHVGRRSHDSIAGEQPVSASAVKVPDQVFGPLPEGGFGMIETSEPREMTKQDIEQTVQDFVQAAHNAVEAGFDGVEIHAAHGYLIDQFMRKASNLRQDNYGGNQQNRMRLLLEVTSAVANAIGGERTAIRVSPFVAEGALEHDDEIEALTLKALTELQPLNLAYVHFSENISNYKQATQEFRQAVRECYRNPVMVAGKLDQQTAQSLVENNYADMVAFGQPFITNPDFVERLQNGWPLTPVGYDAHATFYGGDEKGYSDYPAYQDHA